MPIMLCVVYTKLMILCLQEMFKIVTDPVHMPDFLFTNLGYNLVLS
jgi:hypothetical protein